MKPPPLILHVPHASPVIPADVRPQLALDDAALEHELRLLTDWYTDELFALPTDLAATVRSPVSRLVVDPERFASEDSAAEPLEAVGMGAVYRRTAGGAPLRLAPPEAASPMQAAAWATLRDALLQRFYRPHHAALEAAVRDALAAHGRCLIVDCHSYPSQPLPYEHDALPRWRVVHRPGVCLGTDPHHTPAWLRESAWAAFTEALAAWPLAVDLQRASPVVDALAFDRPFAGTIVPAAFLGSDQRVLSLMVELRRDLYLDEATATKRPGFAACRAAVAAALRRLALG